MPENHQTVPVTERLPPAEARVIVVCEKFRCLGYLDESGVWRHDKDSAEIVEKVVAWYETPWPVR